LEKKGALGGKRIGESKFGWGLSQGQPSNSAPQKRTLSKTAKAKQPALDLRELNTEADKTRKVKGGGGGGTWRGKKVRKKKEQKGSFVLIVRKPCDSGKIARREKKKRDPFLVRLGGGTNFVRR